jgi:hypothetical protein
MLRAQSATDGQKPNAETSIVIELEQPLAGEDGKAAASSSENQDNVKIRSGLAPCQPGMDESGKRVSNNTGIHVGCPKVYDNRTLELMLAAAEQDLARLRFFDQSGISRQIGALQGGVARESSFGIQLLGAPSPQVVDSTGNAVTQVQGSATTVAPIGTTTTLGTTTADTATSTVGSTTGTTVTQNSVIPVAPTPGALAGASSLPSSFSVSALDTLNEQLQLTYEIANLRLLLEGSLSDHFVGASRNAKRRITLGFPISIEPPAFLAGTDAVAEVEVEVATRQEPNFVLQLGKVIPQLEDPYRVQTETFRDELLEFRGLKRETLGLEPPNVVTILPRQRTYNTAHITDKQSSFAGAAVINIVSLGVSRTRRTRTYYLLQDLDTIAVERAASSDPASATSFAWQFRPVLNQPSVVTGLRQTFVQLTFPLPGSVQTLGTAQVTVRWRKYDRKTRMVGEVIRHREHWHSAPEKLESTIYVNAPITNFDLTPLQEEISTEDVGQGLVAVEIGGTFLPNTEARSGNLIFSEAGSTLLRTPAGLRVLAPASTLMGSGLTLVARDGSSIGVHSSSLLCIDRKTKRAIETIRLISSIVEPYNSVESRITVKYEKVKNVVGSHLVALLGERAFGLRDAPFASFSESELVFFAPTSLVRSARNLTLGYILCGRAVTTPISIPGDFTATKLSRLASADGSTTFAVTGSNLAVREEGGGFKAVVQVHAVISGTPTVLRTLPVSSDTLVFHLNGAQISALKQVYLIDSDRKAQPVFLALSSPSAPTNIEAPAPILKGAARPLVLSGSNLDAVVAIRFKEDSLIAIRSLDNSTITVELPEAVTMHVPSSTLTAVLRDRTEIPVNVTVVER